MSELRLTLGATSPETEWDRPHLNLDVQSWMADAACADYPQSVFFPDSCSGGIPLDTLYAQARLICAGCPVQDDCAEYAIEHGEADGMWGGLTPMARTAVRRGASIEVARRTRYVRSARLTRPKETGR